MKRLEEIKKRMEETSNYYDEDVLWLIEENKRLESLNKDLVGSLKKWKGYGTSVSRYMKGGK